MTKYFMLECNDCREEFRDALASTPEELLCPDFNQAAEEAGRMKAERLRRFHERHTSHNLQTKEVEVQPCI